MGIKFQKTLDKLFSTVYNVQVNINGTFAVMRREGYKVAEVRIKDNESLENALRRFKRQVTKSGIMGEMRKREHYEKPSVKRKKKSEAARKRKYK